MLGYLLSNGCVGYFDKTTSTNFVLEYGSENYHLISKSSNFKPIKKPYPF